MKCHYCGNEYTPSTDMLTGDEVCVICGKMQPDPVIAGQIRELLKDIVIEGWVVKIKGDWMHIDKILNGWADVDQQQQTIKKVPVKWIYENTKLIK